MKPRRSILPCIAATFPRADIFAYYAIQFAPMYTQDHNQLPNSGATPISEAAVAKAGHWEERKAPSVSVCDKHSYAMLPSNLQREIALSRDFDGDGKPESIYGAEGALRA